jgi:hypothetical protein
VRHAAWIELSDLNFAESNRELSRRAGGAVHDEDGLLYWVAPHPLPVLANAVFPTGPAPSGAELVRRARAFFAGRNRGFTVTLRAHADGEATAAVRAAGLREWGNAPAMVLDRRLSDAVAPAGVSLQRVESDADVADFANVMRRAYATYGMPDDVAAAVLGKRDVLVAPHVVAFLARLDDGTPAAGAMTIVTHGVAGVYWVGTIPDARGRGLAELCTRAAGNAGFDLGAGIASLQASEMGEPVYRRMGYVEVTRYPSFVQFSAPTAADG